MESTIKEHIELTLGVLGGKARIAGHRISVADIVILYDKHGFSADAILTRFPDITLSDVHAAMAYYYDHIEEVDRSIREDEELVEKLKAEMPSQLQGH